MRLKFISLAILLLALLTAAAVADEHATRTITRSFSLGAADEFALVLLAGAITIEPTGGSEFTLEATIHSIGETAAEAARIGEMMDFETRTRGSRLIVISSLPLDRYRTYFYPGTEDRPYRGDCNTEFDGARVRVTGYRGEGLALWADVRLGVPAASSLLADSCVGPVDFSGLEADLSVDTGSGDVTGSEHIGSLSVDTGSGDVEVADVRGDVSVDTGSGDVTFRGLAGSINADTGSGDVRLLSVNASSVLVDTGSGDVHVDLGNADCDRIIVDTGSGDVILEVPMGASLDVEFEAGSGQLSYHLREDPERERYDDDELVGFRLGDGRTRVRVDTGSGDLDIRQR